MHSDGTVLNPESFKQNSKTFWNENFFTYKVWRTNVRTAFLLTSQYLLSSSSPTLRSSRMQRAVQFVGRQSLSFAPLAQRSDVGILRSLSCPQSRGFVTYHRLSTPCRAAPTLKTSKQFNRRRPGKRNSWLKRSTWLILCFVANVFALCWRLCFFRYSGSF